MKTTKSPSFVLQQGQTRRTLLNIFLLVFVSILLLISIFLVRTKLLQNTHQLGMALVQSYAVEETVTHDSLRDTVLLASQYIDEICKGGGNADEVQRWLQSYFGKLTDIIGTDVVDPYVIIDGQLIGAHPWEGASDYDYAETLWYKQAMENGATPTFTPVYTDIVTGKLVTTISMELSRPGDVLALDVYIQNDQLHNNTHTLPDGYSYYLCDENGTLLYAVNQWDSDRRQLQNFAAYLMNGIRDGSLLAYDAYFDDPVGVRRGAYFDTMDNGWTVIITIPINSILMGKESTTVYVIAGIAAFLFVMLTFLTVQDVVRGKKMKKADDTAHMLGDSFYAIFRINFRRGTYEAIKLTPNMKGLLAPQGEYDTLLTIISQNAAPATHENFAESFSLASIQHRVEKNILDYGGDYQRLFGTTYRWVNVRTLYSPELAPDEVILCFRDVDAEKRQQMQNVQILQEALDLAHNSTKAKSEFFSNMSHDMRTPLNAIIGFCTLAHKDLEAGSKEKVADCLAKIEFAGNQLLNLINDILELSRMEAGKVSLDQKEFDLKSLVEHTADLFRNNAQETYKILEVTTDIRDSLVLGDKNVLSQILNNLLSNAFKYSDSGATVRLTVTQLDYQQSSQYRFVVADTGIGMSKEFLEHLFEPYSRETSFTAHSTVGTGLGMTIVKGLVQQMSGDLTVDSELGKGTCFTFTVPLQKSQRLEPVVSPPSTEPFDWNGLRVLVAEDNPLNREILTELLQMSGAEVLQAINGAEAVHTFLDQPPYSVDLILMDMRMPVMDGCQAARTLRRLPRADAEWVPIIAVTANAFAEDIEHTIQAGMDDHVPKPIDFGHLSEVVKKIYAKKGKPTDPARK